MAYKDSKRLLPAPEEEEDIISIEKALATLRNVKTTWIRGKPKLIPGQQRFWYTACMKCKKSVHADIEWTIRCPTCKEETQVEARCRTAIALDDGTRSMNAVILGMDAKKLIPYASLDLKEADDQDIETQAGLKDPRYTVVKAYIAEEFMDISLATTNKDPAELLSQVTSSSMPTENMLISNAQLMPHTQHPSSSATQPKTHFTAEPSPSKRRRHHTS